jgi:hypothetical protein
MMRRVRISLVVALTGLVLIVPATEAAKTKRHASEVEIAGAHYGHQEPFGNYIAGDVHSKKPKCERNREVSLYLTPSGEGRQRIGTVTTDRTGDWELATDEAFSNDAFDATVARKKIQRPGKDIVCKADESPSLVIDPVV